MPVKKITYLFHASIKNDLYISSWYKKNYFILLYAGKIKELVISSEIILMQFNSLYPTGSSTGLITLRMTGTGERVLTALI